MSTGALSAAVLDRIFRQARTFNGWLDRPVTDETLHEIHELMKWGPTSANASPARVFFLRGPLSGFENAKVDDAFFNADRECEGCNEEFFPSGRLRSNFLCNLAYGDPASLHTRGPRLAFEEACTIL